ncbi:hypothetical protein M3J09_002439 [Ascochyta lentis]
MEEHPYYNSLSYAWRDTTCTIVVKGGANIIWIPRSVYEALLHLSKTSDNSMLRIDAVCIDQGNLREGNQQVEMMYRICSSAGHVSLARGRR